MEDRPAAPPVYSPCAKKWEFMHAAGLRTQFCGRCQLPVHNLSALSQREAERFLAGTKGRRTCITYQLRRDGTMVTRTLRDLWRWQRVRLLFGVFATVRAGILIGYLWREPLGHRGLQAKKML